MSDTLQKRLTALLDEAPRALNGGLTGLEKESLRVAKDGYLATTAHPRGLGSALTNRFITTDFSEALLEFVTPAFDSPADTLECLTDIHRFTMAQIDDELLWNASMPCLIGDEQAIPLARYGTSNVARMKTIYRRGLSYRYGRAMQTIAGVHFNFSLPEAFWPVYQQVCEDDSDIQAFRSAGYLSLARNFRRVGWIVLYLFGASPAMCKSFLGDRPSALAEFDAETLFEPYATSLRMSDLGYNSKAQSRLKISLNTLDEYIAGLTDAIMKPHADYESIGVKVAGQWRQLNTNLLQIENEYYSSIRPKQVALSGERPTLALQRAGVQYVEVRSLDINPYDPVGVGEEQMYFMQALLVSCLLRDSAPLSSEQMTELDANHVIVAHSGRAPALELSRDGKPVSLQKWAGEILRDTIAVARAMDGGDGPYTASCEKQKALIGNSDLTPSARLLAGMLETGQSFHEFTMAQAQAHADYFAALEPMPAARWDALKTEAADSVLRQQQIEEGTQRNFDEYLADYFYMV